MGREGYWAAMTTSRRSPAALEAIDKITSLEQLDQPAKLIGKAVRDAVPAGPVKDALSGTWLGHALHPLLTDLPIGTWTSAVLLDWLGGERSEAAADRLIALGIAFTAPAVATGWTEWADSEVADDGVRRIGIVHAAANVGATTLFGASLVARRGGSRGTGKLLALAGASSGASPSIASIASWGALVVMRRAIPFAAHERSRAVRRPRSRPPRRPQPA